jgi:preprotein translocase subunit SecF
MVEEQQTSKSSWYDKHYKKLLVVPLIVVAVCIVYLIVFYSQTGNLMYRDVSLSGGTTITLNEGVSNQDQFESAIKAKFPDTVFRSLSDLKTGGSTALVIESSSSPQELQSAVEAELGYKLTDQNSSIEFSGASLSEGFYKQLIIALIISFILMSLVIFVMFRTFIPSIAVIFAALSDIIIPLAIVDFFGLKLSAAGIAAFLMLIGYSVDTDILLTSRAIKNKEGHHNERIFGAFKTGILMTGTALAAVLPAFFLVTGLPDSFKQIFLILALGLFADIVNTWLTNASIIKWYCVKKKIE